LGLEVRLSEVCAGGPVVREGCGWTQEPPSEAPVKLQTVP
jgi:hypothetical protein